MNKHEMLIQRRRAVTPVGLGVATPFVVESGSGSMLKDVDGREVIDFASGIGVNGIGHSPEPVVNAIAEQARQLLHTCIMVATYEPYVALCEKLAALLPHGNGTKVLLTNTGAESVENAIKIARQATKRPAVICYSDAFHGRTMMAMTLTSKIGYKRGCGPFAPEVYRLPFPNYFRDGDGLGEQAFIERELHRLREFFLNTVPAEEAAAVIIEIVQGEGGFNVAPPGYLRGLRELCDRQGIVLIFDEVQSGLCRTGKWASYQHSGVMPDISTWAKALGGGLPIGAVIGKAQIMDKAAPGTLGGTYPGNPVACAAALASLELMEREDLNRKAERIGQIMHSRLTELQRRCSLIGNVRGMGAMVAMEMVLDGNPRKPATAQAKELLKACWSRNLLVISAGVHQNIVRFLVPLVMEEETLNRGLVILEEEMERLQRNHNQA